MVPIDGGGGRWGWPFGLAAVPLTALVRSFQQLVHCRPAILSWVLGHTQRIVAGNCQPRTGCAQVLKLKDDCLMFPEEGWWKRNRRKTAG